MKQLARATLLLLALAAWAAAFPFHAAQGREHIVIGVATSLTTLEGRESHNAVQLAAEEINRAGGVMVGEERLAIRVVEVDLCDACDAVSVDAVLEKLERFVKEQGVDAILVGFFRSEALLAGMDLIAEMSIPFLGTIAMSPASEAKVVQSDKYRWVFRLGLNSSYLVEYLIQTMKFLQEQFDVQKVHIINQDVAWAKTTASLMIKLHFERAGWEVVGLDVYPSGTSTFRKSLEAARMRRADVILPIFDMPESGLLVREWNRMESRAILCGFISPMMGPGAWKAFEEGIGGALNVVFELGNVPSDVYPPAKRFYDAYKKRFGREIESGHGPAPAYESVYVFAEAVERAGTLDPDAVVKALEQTDRCGTMGRTRFHRGRQVVFGEDPREEALACVIQWTEDGRRRVVYPPSIAEGPIELPRTSSGQ
ncbi:MAG: ABC transporter substrate-binding protein [Desulfatiglandales bacterium]